ncbi:MAG: hypothetical protein AAGK21_15570 [Bacteroidota bacterium]
MGQQQLLLLIVGVVVVGLAVMAGVEAFAENQRKFRQDQTVHLMNDIASKAQLWKMTPPLLGGGNVGNSDDFSAFTLNAIGLQESENHGGVEVLHRTEYACLKLFPNTDRLRIHALNTDCTDGSWWMGMDVRGVTPEDITVDLNPDAGAVTGNGQ